MTQEFRHINTVVWATAQPQGPRRLVWALVRRCKASQSGGFGTRRPSHHRATTWCTRKHLPKAISDPNVQMLDHLSLWQVRCHGDR